MPELNRNRTLYSDEILNAIVKQERQLKRFDLPRVVKERVVLGYPPIVGGIRMEGDITDSVSVLDIDAYDPVRDQPLKAIYDRVIRDAFQQMKAESEFYLTPVFARGRTRSVMYIAMTPEELEAIEANLTRECYRLLSMESFDKILNKVCYKTVEGMIYGTQRERHPEFAEASSVRERVRLSYERRKPFAERLRRCLEGSW